MPISTHDDAVAVVVDAFSSGAYLAPAFLAHGIRSVHVVNVEGLAPSLLPTGAPEYFVEAIEFRGDLRDTVERLAPYRCEFVLPGTESGVVLADELGEALGIPCRNPRRSTMKRRDKAEMQEALRDAGLPGAEQVVVESPSDARTWASERGRWPVVLKPLRSAGMHGVHVCDTADDLSHAVEELLGADDFFGRPNTRVLVQEFLIGQEYMVNALSIAGCHRVLEIIRVTKALVDGSPVYDYADLVFPSEDDHGEVAEYSRRVLSAVEMQWGPSHLEVMLTADGPRLVEVNARLVGALNASASTRTTGQNQAVATVCALLCPAQFLAEASEPVRVHLHCRGVSLICPRDGVVTRELDWGRFSQLESCQSVRPRLRAGAPATRTHDLMSNPGAVYLVHADADVVEADYQQIRTWEAEDFYEPVR
jgi:ATP-grasp domain